MSGTSVLVLGFNGSLSLVVGQDLNVEGKTYLNDLKQPWMGLHSAKALTRGGKGWQTDDEACLDH